MEERWLWAALGAVRWSSLSHTAAGNPHCHTLSGKQSDSLDQDPETAAHSIGPN